jgi:hypothetical protein
MKKTGREQEGRWDYVDTRKGAATPVAQTRTVSSPRQPDLPVAKGSRFLADAEQLAGPIMRYRVRREAAREIFNAQLQRLRMAVEARLKCERATIDLEVEKVMVEIREERLTFLDHFGVREVERLRGLARKKERLFVEWFADLQTSDMPEFMRSGLVDRVMRRWEREMNEIFGTDE